MAETYATFANYVLLKQRSEDGFGSLWRAGEMERGGFRRVAWLRRFDPMGFDGEAAAQYIGLAAELAPALKATNIVRNTLAGVEAGVPFLAWDYTPAQPLDQLLVKAARERVPVAIDNSILMLEKLAAALVAALELRVQGEPLVHGFLVPHLVLVGNDGEPLLAGFGLGRGLLANLDQAPVRKAAAPYLAPEVLAGGSANRRGDVYSLGAIFYHLLTAAPLPAEPSARGAAIEAPMLAFSENPVSQDLLAVFRRALADRPEDRHASATEFKRDLEKLLQGGSYSPTTFNLALFMDRLYRDEIEEEDHEFQRERNLDISPYYKPPQEASEAVATSGTPPSSRLGLYLGLGGAAAILAVAAYLLFGRAPAPQPVDEEARQRVMAELVQSEVTKLLEETEKRLRTELEAEKARTEALRKELEKKQVSAEAGRLSPEERQRLNQARTELAAREAEQRRKTEELQKVQEQRAQAEATASVPEQPAPAPAASGEVPEVTPAPVRPTAAPMVAAEPTAVSRVVPTAVMEQAAVRKGALVEDADVQPVLIYSPTPEYPRLALLRGIAGNVSLSVLVDEEGAVKDVQVLRGVKPDAGLDQAAVDAVRNWRFRPATKAGVPVKVWYPVTIPFKLVKQ